jgi:hypothetical protein
MPDGDVFTWSVRRGWQAVATALRDDLPVDECARRVENALAKHLRKSKGLDSADMQHLIGEAGGARDERRVVAALKELARRDAFERVVPLLIGDGRFPHYDAAQAFISSCLNAARLDVLARSLVRRPDAVGLRRPSRRRSSTTDLMNERAPLGNQA